MNKFLSLVLLLSIGCSQSMDRRGPNPNTEPRLRQREQFEYFREIPRLLEVGNLEEAQERVTFLRSVQDLGRWFYVSAGQLDELEAQLTDAQREQEDALSLRDRQIALQAEYEEIEGTVVLFRDEQNIDEERATLIQLWQIGRELEEKPATLSAHMVRLLQIEECQLASENDLAIRIDVQTDIERFGDSIAQNVKEIMLYGVEGQPRCASPFQRLFDEAKAVSDSDAARSLGLLEFLRVVGDESLRTSVEIFMALGEEGLDEGAPMQPVVEEELPMGYVLGLPVLDRERAYLDASDEDLQQASVLAEQNQDMEVVGRFAQQIADEAFARQFVGEE